MNYWKKTHPHLPEPQLSDIGTETLFEIVVNGVKITMHFETKEAMYLFEEAYIRATKIEATHE